MMPPVFHREFEAVRKEGKNRSMRTGDFIKRKSRDREKEDTVVWACRARVVSLLNCTVCLCLPAPQWLFTFHLIVTNRSLSKDELWLLSNENFYCIDENFYQYYNYFYLFLI